VTVAVEKVPRERLSRYGVVRPAEGEEGVRRAASGEPFPIIDFVEKPAPEDAPSDLAISARYIFSPEIFPALTSLDRGAGSEFPLTKAMAALAQAGRPVIGVKLSPGERRLDIGNHDSYAEAWKVLGGEA
jgi:UTP--glucose-1-phosphate uridylyltransferase